MTTKELNYIRIWTEKPTRQRFANPDPTLSQSLQNLVAVDILCKISLLWYIQAMWTFILALAMETTLMHVLPSLAIISHISTLLRHVMMWKNSKPWSYPPNSRQLSIQQKPRSTLRIILALRLLEIGPKAALQYRTSASASERNLKRRILPSRRPLSFVVDNFAALRSALRFTRRKSEEISPACFKSCFQSCLDISVAGYIHIRLQVTN